MGNQRCVNGKLDTSNYSSPVPTIGLYITGSTLVCLLFILLDIYAGFRNRKRWLPCRFFSLNSVTLTLLGVAAKLPVDLTTAMPSAQDQLSKLTGTSFICICMGFFMPSLGLTTDSECLSNMIFLTIFVITVLVNICIQMHTGVITSFKAEHIIILCCMMLLLMMLWHYAPMLSAQKQVYADFTKSRLANGDGSLLERLKTCYLCTFQSNPQFMFCRKLMCPSTSVLCAICSAVLLQAVFRYFTSKELQFCEGISDYKWSMWTIVVSQTITVLVGFLSTIIRLVTVAGHVRNEDILRDSFACRLAGDITWFGNPFTRIVMCPVGIIVNLINVLAVAPYLLVSTLKMCFRVARHGACSNICKPKEEGGIEEMSEGNKIVMHDGSIWMQYMDDWTIRKV